MDNISCVCVCRSIVWLQTQRDVTLERQRAPGLSPRRDDPHEFRVGRLKHERVKVPRGNALLSWAQQVMKVHAERKSILEVEFSGEEGTGLGPTLEFYALVAAELQRRDLGLWLCDDDHEDETAQQVRTAYVERPHTNSACRYDGCVLLKRVAPTVNACYINFLYSWFQVRTSQV